MKTFVINLKESVERRAAIEAECAKYGIEAEIVEAVRGKDLSEEELTRLVDPEARAVLTAGEIGCSLSHLKIYELMVAQNIPIALVLEDDVGFTRDPGPFIRAAERVCNKEARAVYLMSCMKVYVAEYKTLSGDFTFYSALNAVGTYAYSITLEAARALLHFALPVKLPHDAWKHYFLNGILEGFVSESEFIDYGKVSGDDVSTISGQRIDLIKTPERRKYEKTARMAPFPQLLRYYLWKAFRKPFLTIVDTTKPKP